MQNSVRIVVLDYYMSAPIPGLDVTYSEFRGTAISQIPILRCFGSTENGKKICVHIHGVFPYLYIPYDGKGKPEELMHQIAVALDRAINISFNQASSNTQHVYKMSLVSGIPMYGYHSKKHQFFKIYLYNPKLIPKVGSLLLNKQVLQQVFQPHEIHLNFTLQFMIDYNLHGMSNMLCSDMKYRINHDNKNPDIDDVWFLPPNIEKTSLCELEADVNAESILNRQEILSGNLAVNPGIAALWEDERQRRRNKNEDSQLGNFLELKNVQSPPTKTHLIFQQALKERLAVLSTDKDIPKLNLEASVYPAETPMDSNIQNASLIDIHSVSSLELSLDDTLNISSSQAHNETLKPNGDVANVTLDEDVQEFLRLLQELAEEKTPEESNTDAGILSQVVPEDQNDDSAEDFLDLSMPLGSLTTPTKVDTKPADHKSDEKDTDYFNTTLIPQIDGQTDYTDFDEEPLSVFKKKHLSCKVENVLNGYHSKSDGSMANYQHRVMKRKCGRSMPLIDMCNIKTNFPTRPADPLNKFNLVPYIKLRRLNLEPIVRLERLDMNKILNKVVRGRTSRTPEDVLEEKLRLIRYRIGRIEAKSRLKRIGRIIGAREKYTMGLLQKTASPVFIILPGRKWFLEPRNREDTNETIVGRLLQLTHNYTDPDLHFLVKTSSRTHRFCNGTYTSSNVCKISSIPNERAGKKDAIKRKQLAFLQKQILNLRDKRMRKRTGGAVFTPVVNKVKKELILSAEKDLIVKIENSHLVQNVASQTPTPVSVKQELTVEPKYESLLRSELQKCTLALRRHLKYLRNFDFNMDSFKNTSSGCSKSLDNIQCLKTTMIKRENTLSICDEAEKPIMDLNVVKSETDYTSVNQLSENKSEHFENDDEENNIDWKEMNVFSPLSENRFENYYEKNNIDWNQTNIFDTDCETTSTILDQNQLKRPAWIFIDTDDELSPKLAALSIKTEIRTPASSSGDSGYASFSGNTPRNISFDSDNEQISDEAKMAQEKSFKKFLSTSADSGFFAKNNFSSSTGNVFDTSRQLADQKMKPQIRVISDIRLLSPFKIEFVQHSASSIPLGDGIECISGSLKSVKEKTQTPVQRGCSANLLVKKPHSIPSIYINCDGAADSSSEEEKAELKKKRVKRRLPGSQYAPLGITVTKSPLVSGNYPGGLEDNMVQISGEHKDRQESTLEVSRPCLSKASTPFKRKLIFENATTLNTTTSEEVLSCTYSTKSSCTQIAETDCKTTPVTDIAKAVEPNNSQNYDVSSSDSDLFSDNDELNRSFFRSYNLTVADKYDNDNKYKAKQGCSTILSANSISNSLPSVKSLSDNTSSDIPPYQVSQGNNNNNALNNELKLKNQSNIIKPSFKAPSRLRVEQSLTGYKIPRVHQQEPYYSKVQDYTGVVEIGHRIMRIATKTTAHLSEFDSEFNGLNNIRKYFVESVANLTWNPNNVKSLKLAHCSHKSVIIHPLKKPPSAKQVREWIKTNSKPCEEIESSPEEKVERTKIYIPNSPGDESDMDLSLSLTPDTISQSKSSSSSQAPLSPDLDHRKTKCKKKTTPDSIDYNKSCQISGVSQQNSFGFDRSVQNMQAVRAINEHQYLTTMVMELHIRTRGDLKPDPQFDCMCAIFYSILNDVPESDVRKSKARGVIAVNCLPLDLGAPRADFLDGIELGCDIVYVETEEALINTFITLIKQWDPDIFAGYEIEMLSWGYLIERASVLSINILPLLGRSRLHKYGKTKLKSFNAEPESNIVGRILLDVWRIMRHEIALQSYTFESIVYHTLHRRIPWYTFKDLAFWWDHRTNLYRHRVVRYYLQRVVTVLELFDKLDFLNRTSELARLFGILFYEVLSRGSQFRVESMMLRLAKPLNYVPVSPDVKQRANMKAPEYIPLVMEPESKLYTDPVIVLDFQSLYPSIIIAYNYCFTTCVGRVNNLGTDHPFEFGATQLKVSRKIADKLCKRDLLNYSPCGVAFVKQKVREGILPRMLKEVLDTRLMVKNSMKENKGNDTLQKVLHNRQLGLKLIANVTYGYTAANFSGRMCCVEVGDSVVSKGRETLQRAIALVESTPEWEAKVVYGDTDSLFVLTPGKTKEEAFDIGKKIADAITADNPDPVKLKLEKVYQPCILQTKKRYVGYMYESPDQKEPVYEAKGIETVRRDGCPAVSKMLQKCLTLLFETKNVSLIKSYVLKQFNKIQTGRASIQDLTFAKEYRGASGYKPGACVPALELARKWKAVDRRSEPRSGERVPYVIVNGPPGLPLIRLVRSPRDLLNDSSLRPNALYYITKVIIPPINRCFNLIGADLNTWFNQMPRKHTQYLPNSSPIIKSTISQYFVTKMCACCSEPTQDGLCAGCCRKPNVTVFALAEKLKKWEENYNNALLICQSCSGCLDEIVCTSLDCPVLYRRIQTYNDLQQSTYVRELLATSSAFSEDGFFEQFAS